MECSIFCRFIKHTSELPRRGNIFVENTKRRFYDPGVGRTAESNITIIQSNFKALFDPYRVA